MPDDIKDEEICEENEDETGEAENKHHMDHVNKKSDDKVAEVEEKAHNHEGKLMLLSGFLCLCVIGLLVATIVLAVQDDDSDDTRVQATDEAPVFSNVPDNTPYDLETVFAKESVNICVDKDPLFENEDCIHTSGPQAGANVTKGYQGDLDVGNGTTWNDLQPNLNNYWQSSMCPVNVHWHLGTEHYSVNEYDEFGDGPNGNAEPPKRRLAATGGEGVRGGFRCHHYDDTDPIFTTTYNWKHCVGMIVGETYEVHWPHSAAGACGTVHQYQTPFYDGVFCNLNDESIATLGPQDIANAVGVQGQIFTIVNDESYFYPDLIRGWIVDPERNMGTDIAYYTGSTTGTSRNNEICSTYTPITWQVDRRCHMISASSFDKLCYDMKQQLDDMSDDLYAHGSRILVNSTWSSNNHHRRRRQRKLLSSDGHHSHDHAHYHSHDHAHYHSHDHAHYHSHGHDHDHTSWLAW